MKRVLLLVPCGVALCALNVKAAIAQEAPPLPEPIEEMVVAQPAVVSQWRERTMTAEEAWRKGLLDQKSAMALLEGGSISGSEGDDQRMRVAVVGLLMKHAPQSLEPVDKLSLRIKQGLAEYYASIQDDRAIGLYEELLKHDEFGPYAKGLLFKALGRFYSLKQQDEKAVAVFLRAQVMLANAKQKRFAAEMLVEAGSSYKLLGQEQKAQETYARVAASGDDWMHALALENQAFFAYQAGDFASSRKYAQAAITKFDLVSGSIGVAGYKSQTEKLIEYSNKWEKEPFTCQPREIRIDGIDGTSAGTVTKRFSIRTQRTVALTVTCDNPQVTIRLDEKSLPNDRDYLRYYS